MMPRSDVARTWILSVEGARVLASHAVEGARFFTAASHAVEGAALVDGHLEFGDTNGRVGHVRDVDVREARVRHGQRVARRRRAHDDLEPFSSRRQRGGARGEDEEAPQRVRRELLHRASHGGWHDGSLREPGKLQVVQHRRRGQSVAGAAQEHAPVCCAEQFQKGRRLGRQFGERRLEPAPNGLERLETAPDERAPHLERHELRLVGFRDAPRRCGLTLILN
mmetsp:Transcript_14144/g.47199  ORF Transcript_14144/g.47199 Transcript_14144/m.47199 type:complete len:223 (+) Transcript_14144:116-784(+)